MEKQRRVAADRLILVDARLAAARQHWRGAQQQLSDDAFDLALPPEMEGLLRVETALGHFEHALQALLLEAQNVRHGLPELDSQVARFDEMAQDVAARRAHLAQVSALFEDMTTRLQVLRETVGAKV